MAVSLPQQTQHTRNALCAETLIHAERVVFAVFDKGGKAPLHERLPDKKEVSFGGGTLE